MIKFKVGDEVVAHTMIGEMECVKSVIITHATEDQLVAQAIHEPRLRQTFNRYGVIGKPGLSGHVWLTPKVIG